LMLNIFRSAYRTLENYSFLSGKYGFSFYCSHMNDYIQSKINCKIYCDIIVNRWIRYRQKNNLPTEFKKNGEIFSELQK
jgi:hypothetical protein